MLFAGKQTRDTPPCAYIIPMDFVARNSPLDPEKVLSDIRKAYGAE